MSRSEIVLLYETADERETFAQAYEILSQMGISFREEAIASPPTVSSLQHLLVQIGPSVCIWAAGRSAYLLPIFAASLTQQQPLVVVPCPSPESPTSYLDTLFEIVRGYPIAFARPNDIQGATLLAVHLLAARHPSYADLLQAYLHKRIPQLN